MTPPSALVAIGLILVVAVFELVRRRRLKERFAVVWLVFAVVVALGVLFPGLVAELADRLGFVLPANLVFILGMVTLAFVSIQLSIEAGRLRDSLERVVSRLAVLEAQRALDANTDATGDDP